MPTYTPSVKELRLALERRCEKLVLKEHLQPHNLDVQKRQHVKELRVNVLPF